MQFDPDAPAKPGAGIFGLTPDPSRAQALLVPVPFDATTSYRPGTAAGPAAILTASAQVDLFDTQFGRVFEQGICMLPEDPHIRAASVQARRAVEPILARGGATAADTAAVAMIDRAGALVNESVHTAVTRILAEGKVPGLVGGDHSVSFGAFQAAAQRYREFGILHVDAHCDLRDAYEGFRWSHASIMHNAIHALPELVRLVQVGIRDVGVQEVETVTGSAGRIVTHFDLDWQRRLATGETYASLCREALAALPNDVWVSFDIDGLDPSLCPHTGTPVPGGLTFTQACLLLESLQTLGRRVIGFDLTEVAPGPPGDEWDAAVGARVLYKLCGVALARRR